MAVNFRYNAITGQTEWTSYTQRLQTGYAGIQAGQHWMPIVAAPAPVPAAASTPSIEPALDNNVSVSVYGQAIPISAGLRRVPGDLLWLEKDQLNTVGAYTAHAAYGFGYRLKEDATAQLVKLWANGTVLYDTSTGFTAEGFALEAEYDGSQTAVDAAVAADRGAAITSAWKQQLYVRCLIPTKEFGNTLPNFSALWSDDAGGSLFRPWGGTWDPLEKSSSVTLTDNNLTATASAQGGVRSTVSHSSGRWYFEVRRNASGGTNFGGVTAWRWGFRTDVSTPGYAYHLGSTGAATLCYDINGGILTNGLGAGSAVCAQTCPLGGWVGCAVDLDALLFWMTDGVTFHGPNPLIGDPVAGTNGLISLQSGFLGSPTDFFVAWSGNDAGDSITLNPTNPVFSAPGESGPLTLVEVILAVARRCGLIEDNFTFVGLDDILVTGIVITSTTDFRAFLQNAGRTYGFDYTESGGRILVKKAVLASAYTIDFTIADYELVPLSDEAVVQTTRADTTDYPTVFEFKYQDETIDFQPSMQRARREEARVMRISSFAVPFVMNATEGLTGSTTALYREWQQRTTHSLKTAFRYLNLEPTDLIRFTVDDVTYTAKVTNTVKNSDLTVSITGVNLLTAEADLRTIDGVYQGGEYAGGGSSGDPNINNLPMGIPFGGMDFSNRANSGYVGALSGI